MNDTQVLELFRIVTEAVDRNTVAMDKVAVASDAMATQVKGLRATIQGAQRKIGGEMGAVIEKSKETLGKLEAEREEVRRAGSQAEERGSADARP